MELSSETMEALNQVLAKQIKEAYRALSTQFQQQLEQFSSKCEERIKGIDKLKRKRVSKPVTTTVKEEEEVSHSLYLSHSESNKLYDPKMSTFKSDYEDALARIKSTCHNAPLTSVKAKCDISSMQSDFVLDKLTPKEPVQPSSIILVPQALERKSVEEAQKSLPLIINLENKRLKPPDRERNQLPIFISFIFPKEIPPDEAYQRIHDTQVSLSCEFIHHWNNFTYARVIKQPVLTVETSSIMDLIFSISVKEDTGSFDVCKRLTRTGTLRSLKVDQMEHPNSVLTSVKSSSTPYPFTLMTTENPKHFIQVSDSFSRFVSHELKAGNMSLFYPRIIEKKLGLFEGRLKQNSYLNMLEKELDDKDNYLDGNEISLLVYRYSMTVIMHLFFAKGVAYIAGVKEEPPDLKVLSITFFTRTGIGVDLTKGKTDLRSNLSQEGGDDMIMASQEREVSIEPEIEGRIELRRCLKQFIRLLQKVYSIFRGFKCNIPLPLVS